MDKIEITGIPPYDGEHEINFQFTMREHNTIKRISQGLRPTEYDDAIRNKDSGFYAALAVVALQQNGKAPVEDILLDARGGLIMVVFGEDADADPPPQLAGVKPSEPPPSSGESSSTTGDRAESDPSPTGSPG